MGVPAGGSLQKWFSAIESNTKATTKLSSSFDAFAARADGTLTDHGKRITRMDDRWDRASPP